RRRPSFADELTDDVAAAVPHGNVGELLDPEKARERGSDRPEPAVLRLERDPAAVRAGRAEETLGATLRDPAGPGPHQVGVGRVGRAADELRARGHRVADSLRRARES